MLHRPIRQPGQSLEVRRTITGELRERLREVPAAPFDWTRVDMAALLGLAGAPADLRLEAMSRLLCTAPGRTQELRALWKECVVTAACAWRLAGAVGADQENSAIAGLLHRLGDILTIRAIAEAEHASGGRLDATSKSELCVELGGQQLERAVRAWGVPARAATTASEWRRLHEYPAAAADATTVYMARLFAIELLTPQFCAPGLLEHAAEESGLPRVVLSAMRSDDTIRELAASLQ
jgi:hypothetical protein